MPPQVERRMNADDTIKILTKLEELSARFDALDKRLDQQDRELDCLQSGINGTPQAIGLAGEVRVLKDWREKLEREAPLAMQIKDLVDWQRGINRVLLFVGTPLFGMVLIGLLTLLWGMLTNRIEILVH